VARLVATTRAARAWLAHSYDGNFTLKLYYCGLCCATLLCHSAETYPNTRKPSSHSYRLDIGRLFIYID